MPWIVEAWASPSTCRIRGDGPSSHTPARNWTTRSRRGSWGSVGVWLGIGGKTATNTENWDYTINFHGISWDFMGFHGISWLINEIKPSTIGISWDFSWLVQWELMGFFIRFILRYSTAAGWKEFHRENHRSKWRMFHCHVWLLGIDDEVWYRDSPPMDWHVPSSRGLCNLNIRQTWSDMACSDKQKQEVNGINLSGTIDNFVMSFPKKCV